MKALHLTNYFFPEYSGTTTRLYNIASRLPFDVQILTSDRTGEGTLIAAKEEQFGNINVRRIPLVPDGIMQDIPAVRYFHTLYRRPSMLVRAALAQPFDIIHAHNSLTFGEAAERLSKRLDKPFILELHGLSHESSAGVLGKLKAWHIRQTDRRLLERCNHAVTLTQKLKEWITGAYGLPESKITVVPNGADIEHFSPRDKYKEKSGEIRVKLGAKGKIVMYAGNMDKINGMEVLARIIPEIIRQRPDISFVFIGQKPPDKYLTSLSVEFPANVKFIPPVPYEEMPAYYQTCDVFVVPRPSTVSSETLTPLKLLEVMAMARPVLGSSVGGIAEVVKDGWNGYLFKKDDLTDFKRRLLEALEADNKDIGNNARKTIIEGYTWEKSVKNLIRVYEAIS